MVILLPKDSRISLLIAEEVHRDIGHLGEAATLAAIRAKYWILGTSNREVDLLSVCTV